LRVALLKPYAASDEDCDKAGHQKVQEDDVPSTQVLVNVSAHKHSELMQPGGTSLLREKLLVLT
jgi:hypothetical protein